MLQKLMINVLWFGYSVRVVPPCSLQVSWAGNLLPSSVMLRDGEGPSARELVHWWCDSGRIHGVLAGTQLASDRGFIIKEQDLPLPALWLPVSLYDPSYNASAMMHPLWGPYQNPVAVGTMPLNLWLCELNNLFSIKYLASGILLQKWKKD